MSPATRLAGSFCGVPTRIVTEILSAIENLIFYPSPFTDPLLGLRSQGFLGLVSLDRHQSDHQDGKSTGSHKRQCSNNSSCNWFYSDVEEFPSEIGSDSHNGSRNCAAVRILARKCVGAWLINTDHLVHHACTSWVASGVNIPFNLAGLQAHISASIL